jgi:hypothetical protein
LNSGEIDEDVKNFLIQHIDSIGKLEVLLLLARNPNTEWTSQSVSQELRSSDFIAEKHLCELSKAGLLICSEENHSNCKYSPLEIKNDSLVQKLMHSYSVYPSRIIHIIYNRPMQILQDFAKAFRIRKDNKDDC